MKYISGGLERETRLNHIICLDYYINLYHPNYTTDVEEFHFLTDSSLSLRTKDLRSFLDWRGIYEAMGANWAGLGFMILRNGAVLGKVAGYMICSFILPLISTLISPFTSINLFCTPPSTKISHAIPYSSLS